MGTIVPVAKTFAWIVDLDLRGQLLRDTVWILVKHAQRFHVLSYPTLRRLLQEELDSLAHAKPTGFVSALWITWRRGFLPRLVAACDRVIAAGGEEDRYLSLLGFDRLLGAGCGTRLERALELTEDVEVRKRLRDAFT